jgi:hypothetical protein
MSLSTAQRVDAMRRDLGLCLAVTDRGLALWGSVRTPRRAAAMSSLWVLTLLTLSTEVTSVFRWIRRSGDHGRAPGC